jgi:tetratricopeptide (TPR) repeat protein
MNMRVHASSKFVANQLWLALSVLLAGASASMTAQRADLAAADRVAVASTAAYQALQDGRVEDAAASLRTSLAGNPGNAYAHQLLCRVFYAQDRADEAVRECESAAALSQGAAAASDNQLWLGRAYGLKARHAGPIGGFMLAKRVQASFAKAVELNPSNVAALNDLGEYYVSAPSIVGGGTDKAKALAADMMPRFPAQAHLLQARIAVDQGNDATAEAEFKQVIALQKNTQAWVDLAAFYETHSRKDDAVSAVRSGLAVDRTHGPAIVDAASVLIAAHREMELAERCLAQYLASKAKTDEAPAFKVHVQLSRLLTARGLSTEAGQHMEAATTLAPVFARSSRQWQGL